MKSFNLRIVAGRRNPGPDAQGARTSVPWTLPEVGVRRTEIGGWALTRFTRRTAWMLIAACLAGFGGRVPVAAANRALLVGVSYYPELAGNPRVPVLRGPPNDVALMRNVLEKLGFPPGTIRVLANIPGSEEPILKNILKELRFLESTSGPGDQVVLFLAGHGSQQPAAEGQGPSEPDGLDEVFLPSDAGNWSEDNRTTIKNGLVDNAIRESVNRIRARGAFVWFVADCCHSGTLSRNPSTDSAVYRRVPGDALLPLNLSGGIRARTRGLEPTRSGAFDLNSESELPGGLVVMEACQPNQLAPERPLPQGAGVLHGLFTYNLAEALNLARRPLTYVELMEQVLAAYRKLGLSRTTPLIDGPDRARLVLGTDRRGEAPLLFLRREDNGTRLKVTGGRMIGLTPGVVLRVLPPPSQGSAPATVGHVAVLAADLLTSQVQPCAFGKFPPPRPETIQDGAPCELVSVGPDDFRLHLGLQVQAGSTDQSAINSLHDLIDAMEATWNQIADHSLVHGRLVRVMNPGEANCLIEVTGRRGGEVELNLVTDPMDTPFGTPAFSMDRRTYPFRLALDGRNRPATDRLATALYRVTRAKSMLQMATTPIEGAGHLEDLGFELSIRRHTDDRDLVGTPVPVDLADTPFRAGELVSLDLRQKGRARIDVYLFSIDADLGITNLSGRQPQTLDEGTSASTPRFQITGPGGLEHVIAIAVRHIPRGTLDFSAVEQDPIDSDKPDPAMSSDPRAPRRIPHDGNSLRGIKGGVPTPLSSWLKHMTTARVSRGDRDLDLSDYRVKVLSYRVTPVDR